MRERYYKEIHLNPAIRVADFLPLIRKAVRDGGRVGYSAPLTLYGYNYILTLSPEVCAGEDGTITLTLIWNDGGQKYRQRIKILPDESHLIAGTYVYYFLCPFGYKSKKLFYVGGVFRSRRTFRHEYKGQNQSRRDRKIKHLTDKGDPYRDYGKPYYKGKLTPYGKRCERYEERQKESITAFFERFGIDVFNQ